MTTLKNFLAVIFAIFLICAPNVEAKIVTDKLPLLTFADSTVSVYDAPNGKNKGTIPAEISLVLVKQILADGWAYGSYKPLNSEKRVYRWFKMTELQGYADFENYTDQLINDTNVYRTRTLDYQYNGNAPSNEDVIVVAQRGSKTKIIFKADGDYYRMGWVDNSTLKKNSGNTSNISDNQNGDNNGEDYDDDK